MATETQSTLATVKKSSRVLVGDCRELLRDLPDECIDAIVTDPPYELGFMGKRWDASGIAYDVNVWREALRVLKPGGHLLAFGGTRTYHRMACAIEDAGFEVRDSIHWIYGSGFPKSMDVSKAIDKAAGAQISNDGYVPNGKNNTHGNGWGGGHKTAVAIPSTDAAKQWQGWGTALKPAHEPIVVARKPLVGTVAANVLAYGTGAINVDGCRVPGALQGDPTRFAKTDGGAFASFSVSPPQVRAEGRWPPNVLLSHSGECGDECADDCAVAEMDRQGDSAKFFPCFHYVAKAGRKERDLGLEGFLVHSGASIAGRAEGSAGSKHARAGTVGPRANTHPTVKPVELMRWLVRLVTPPNGVVLDPFTGSGTTGVACVREGFDFIGCELSDDYASIARARIERG